MNERNGSNTFWDPIHKSNLQTNPIPTLAAGIKLSLNPSEEYGEFSRHLLHNIASLSGVPTLFEEDAAQLTEQQAINLVEILVSVRKELPGEPLIALSVLRADERGGFQFTCFQDFGRVYLDKYRLEYGFHHCENCGYYGNHHCVSILEGQQRVGLFCQNCHFPGNPTKNQPGLFGYATDF